MRRVTGALALAVALAVGCSSGGEDDAAPDPTEPLEILVTNDDGVDAVGIDVLTEALVELDDVEITVVAPAENQSGTGREVTDAELVVEETETSSGYPAVAVDGFPADAVTWVLDGAVGVAPDLVVSGINQGQNVGPLTLISGTVGAALTASEAGIPSLAVSAGLAETIEYDLAADLTVTWVEEHRDALVDGEAPATTTNINIPSCPTVQELVEVPVATETDLNVLEVDCDSTLTDPANDVEGFVNGYAVISEVSAG